MDALAAKSPQRRLIGAVAAIGGASVTAGAMLPWLTVFGGLGSYAGTNGLNGQVLAVGGAGALLLGVWYGVRGQPRLRYAIGGLGFALGVFSAYLVAQLLAVYRALDGFFLPTLGPGLFVATAGALLLISTLFIDAGSQPGDARSAPLDSSAATPIALSAAAGVIHLTVVGQHFVDYAPFGALFVLAGLAQLGWAALVAIHGLSRRLLIAATSNAAVVAIWIISRTTGVPIGPRPGVPEPVGSVDALTTAFEAALVGWVVWWLGRRRAPVGHTQRGQRQTS
jgi:hypothetical protein